MSEYAEVDADLYFNCVRDIKISLKAKGMYILMLTEPTKLYTEYDLISKADKFDSVMTGLKELETNGYIEKILTGWQGYKITQYEVENTDSPNAGYVYIFNDNYDNYKIGKAKNIQRRFLEYRTAMPYEPIVIRIFRCVDMHKTEKELHKRFKNKQIKGEWFKLNDMDIEEINSMSEVI